MNSFQPPYFLINLTLHGDDNTDKVSEIDIVITKL